MSCMIVVWASLACPLHCPQLQIWFAEVLRDGMAAQSAGVYVPFSDFACYHLQRYGAKEGISKHAIEREIFDGLKSATLYPDVGPALKRLQLGGLRLCALTNGSVDVAASAFHRAGLNSQDTLALDVREALAWVRSARLLFSSMTNALTFSYCRRERLGCRCVHGRIEKRYVLVCQLTPFFFFAA